MRIHNPFPLRRCARRGSFWACALLIVPLGARFQVPSDSAMTQDPLATTFTFGAGGGSYARDIKVFLGTLPGTECAPAQSIDRNFVVESSYQDVGGSIDFQSKEEFHFGARGGYVWEQSTYNGDIPENPLTLEPVPIPEGAEAETGFYYINPYIAVEGRRFGLGIGFIYSSRKLATGDTETRSIGGNVENDDGTIEGTMHIRVGSTVYASYQLWEGVPLYSGGGKHVVGLGIRPGKVVHFWGGMATGPYQGNKALFRLDISPSPRWTIHTNYRVPGAYQSTGTARESGASVALSYRIFH